MKLLCQLKNDGTQAVTIRVFVGKRYISFEVTNFQMYLYASKNNSINNLTGIKSKEKLRQARISIKCDSL